MATEQERIEAYRKKIAQLEAKAELKENRQKAEATKGLSAADTRRKILIGALIQEEMEKSPERRKTYFQSLMPSWCVQTIVRCLSYRHEKLRSN